MLVDGKIEPCFHSNVGIRKVESKEIEPQKETKEKKNEKKLDLPNTGVTKNRSLDQTGLMSGRNGVSLEDIQHRGRISDERARARQRVWLALPAHVGLAAGRVGAGGGEERVVGVEDRGRDGFKDVAFGDYSACLFIGRGQPFFFF